MNNRESIIMTSIGFMIMSSLSSCELIANIFKGGMYFGIILVIIVVVLIIWLINKIGRR